MNFNTGNNKKEHTPSSQSNTQENPIQKSLGEILLDDSFHENEEISALDDAIKDSSTDLRNIVDTYDEDLRILEHKRFSIRKPINLYRIEEKIDHLKGHIKTYITHFQKNHKEIARRLMGLYEDDIPTEEKETLTTRQSNFVKVRDRANDQLQKWKLFYNKIEETKK